MFNKEIDNIIYDIVYKNYVDYKFELLYVYFINGIDGSLGTQFRINEQLREDLKYELDF